MSEPFARYQLLDRIAIGGTAEVFRALFVAGDGSKRKVVIKRILPQFARDERFRRLFHEEACVAVTMTHPSIVRVLDHGDIGQTCYITLELVEGKDLGSLLELVKTQGITMPPRIAAYIAVQVSEALQFIHDQTSSEGTPLRIIHRDVSPQNILVSYEGDVKLTDFGIAKSAIRQERTVDGVLRGKLDYMAPEQAALDEVDHRADLFSLGSVLYTMLQGTPPFRGINDLETLERLRLGQFILPPHDLSVSEDLRRIVARALTPDRVERYQQAAQIRSELQTFLAQEPPSLGPADLGQWIAQLLHQSRQAPADRVDDAVRQLLGQEIEEPSSPATSTTTVFATTSEIAPEEPRPARQHASTPGGRLQWALGMAALLGLLGWLLWALNMFHERPVIQSASRSDGASASARSAVDAAWLDRGPSGALAGETDLPRSSTIQLLSEPAGARVLLNGQAMGQTPLMLPRPTAPYFLVMKKKGFRSWQKRLHPGDVQQRLRVVLVSLGARPSSELGRLTINSLPWSKVRVDGRIIGNTPLIKFPVRVGPHRIELLSPEGKVRKSFSVTLGKNEQRSFTFDQRQKQK